MIQVRGIQHIGVTVPDMNQAVDFFQSVFGALTAMECGGAHLDDEFMVRRLGVPAGTRIKDHRDIVCGNGVNLELFEYSGEPEQTSMKRNSEVGGFHLAFQVDDVAAATARLRAAGVEVLDGPTRIPSGPLEGLDWIYLRAPWGLSLELVSWDGALGYEREGGPKMWSVNS